MTNGRKLLLIAAAVFVVEMAFAPLYGYHRDELYFLAAGRHPAWGYVDQPPLTPMIARLSETLFGNSLYGLRLVPALIAAGTVVMAGLLTKEFGGESRAQVLAAVAIAGSSLFLMLGHLLSTATIDA
ncbi:MAG TPA: glycosyltransferase family 39 protein, partial [Actinomycetota bacterium]|nr:glycosyltransferase family 39 protein [Actinomycetota bacterium]